MPTQTQAIVVRQAAGPWELETVTLADVGPDEILVDIVSAGLCHTDSKAASGKFNIKPPLILGHEGAGYVKEVGSNVSSLAVGDAVVLSYASCRTCKRCKSGLAAYCQDLLKLNFSGKRPDGSSVASTSDGQPINGLFFGQSSFSKVALVNQHCAVRVDAKDREELKKLVIGCSIQTGAGSVLKVCNIDSQSTLALWGCGGVGMSAVMAAHTRKPKALIAIDTSSEKLGLAKKYGATQTINASQEDVLSRILAITGGDGVQYALDAVGSGKILHMAQQALAVKGTLLTIGSAAEEASLDTRLQLQKGLSYRGCHQGDSDAFEMIPQLVKMWRSGTFPFDELLSFYSVDQYKTALNDVHGGKVLKAVLTF